MDGNDHNKNKDDNFSEERVESSIDYLNKQTNKDSNFANVININLGNLSNNSDIASGHCPIIQGSNFLKERNSKDAERNVQNDGTKHDSSDCPEQDIRVALSKIETVSFNSSGMATNFAPESKRAEKELSSVDYSENVSHLIKIGPPCTGIYLNQRESQASCNSISLNDHESNNVDTADGCQAQQETICLYEHPPDEISHEVDVSTGDNQDIANNDPTNLAHPAKIERIVELLRTNSRSSDHDDNSLDEENDWVLEDKFYDLDILQDAVNGNVNEEEDADAPDEVDGDDDIDNDDDNDIDDDGDNDEDDDNDDDDDINGDYYFLRPDHVVVYDAYEDLMNEEDDSEENSDDPMGQNDWDDNMDEDSDTNSDTNVGQQRDIRYDTSLPARHNYLGENLEELEGRQILDEQSLTRLPIMEIDRIILLPGQLLPINVRTLSPHVVCNLRDCFENGTRTFGFTCTTHIKPGDYGTTAEIRNYTVDDDGDMKCIIEGGQRFRIITAERANLLCTLYGSVLILPESVLVSPYGPGSSISRFHISEQKDKINRLRGLKFPIWVYKYYDTDELVKKIRSHLKHWLIVHEEKSFDNNNVVESSMSNVTTEPQVTDDSQRGQSCINLSNSDPRSFSYWVAGNLPISLEDRAKALTFDCAEARLIWELSILENRSILCCINCDTNICSKDDAFSMSRTGPQSSYVNEHGYIHDTLTVYKARNLRSDSGSWQEQYSWFPGYSWRICCCINCYRHIGWCFKTFDENVKPKRFYGLSRQNIRLK